MTSKNLLKATLACFFLISTNFSFAGTQSEINRVLQQYASDVNVGIMVQSLNTGKTIYQKNANQLFMPASILKIFPAVAALSFLGTDYSFQTKILAPQANITQNTINSDVYFYFDGDPSLTQQDISDLVTTLTQTGITTINGNIYIDDYVFDQKILGPGWTWDELNFCYASPTSAITIDKNCFTLQLKAAAQSEQPATLTSNKNNILPIVNHVTSRSSTQGCPLDLHATDSNIYDITGCVKTNTPTRELSFAIRNVRLYAKNVVLKELQDHNIKLLGEIKFKRLPQDLPMSTLAEHKSASLYELIKIMLKKSDNLIADSVYKKIGNTFFHKTASWNNSAKAIANILAPNTKIAFNKMHMVDGSGLSRNNLVAPAQLVALLHYAYDNKNIAQNFITALPEAGVNGTLQYRMTNLRGRVHAKTGNMKSISSLAGYIKTIHGDNLAFAIIVNSFLGNRHKYHTLQDKICTILATTA